MANYMQLFRFATKFEAWKNAKAPEYYLHKREIEFFFLRNDMHIKIMNHAVNEQNKKYFKYGLNGDMIMHEGNPIFIDESMKEEYTKILNELMSRKFEMAIAGHKI